MLSDFRSKFAPFASVEPSRRITELHEQVIDAITAKEKEKIVGLIKEDMAITKQILMSRPHQKAGRNRPGSLTEAGHGSDSSELPAKGRPR